MNECKICEKLFFNEDYFTLKACKHKFCLKCLHDFINDNLDVKVKCPLQNCRYIIQDSVIRKCLSEAKTNIFNLQCARSSSCKIEDVMFHCDFCEQPNCTKCKKRHNTTKSCGDLLDENAINARATESLNRHRMKYLKGLCQTNGFVKNPEGFECDICTKFILPREGIMLRGCFHFSCRKCFEDYCQNNDGILKCGQCETIIDDKDLIQVLHTSSLKDRIVNYAAHKFYTCKYPDCNGLWDRNACKSKFHCPKCNHENCLDCEDVHENMSCENFKQGKKFQDILKAKEKMDEIKKVKCWCGKVLNYGKGCGALYCDNCHQQVCLFTGKKPGNYGPESCGCTPNEPCHEDCKHGCFPDDKKKKSKQNNFY